MKNDKISQVKTILISGSDCLSNANISSNFGESTRWSQSDRILTLKVNCDTSNAFDIYCTKNDTCNIDCMTKKACDKMKLHCDGNCNVSKSMCIHIDISITQRFIVMCCIFKIFC